MLFMQLWGKVDERHHRICRNDRIFAILNKTEYLQFSIFNLIHLAFSALRVQNRQKFLDAEYSRSVIPATDILLLMEMAKID